MSCGPIRDDGPEVDDALVGDHGPPTPTTLPTGILVLQVPERPGRMWGRLRGDTFCENIAQHVEINDEVIRHFLVVHQGRPE